MSGSSIQPGTSASGQPFSRSRGAEHRYRPPHQLDLALTLRPLARGPLDPTTRIRTAEVWRATRTPAGPASLRLRQEGPELVAEAWGPGAEWVLDQVPELVGGLDDLTDFAPRPGLVAELHHRRPGLRICRSRAVFEALVPTILEQKVPGVQAFGAYRGLIRIFGEPAPGPLGLLLPPSPATLAALPYWRLHRLDVERRRADTIRRAALSFRRLEEVVSMAPEEARARLTALPGVGAWSAAEVAIRALGDADAVSIGDYHLPNLVSWTLAGEARGTDQRMLELLEPYRGHRGRVLRLLEGAGRPAPRFGPRMALRHFGHA